jgi:hypothetical protein
MPTKKAAKAYRCLRSFSYPESLAIRNRIRDGDHMEERGEWVRYAERDKITNPPSDLIKGWLRRGFVEPIKAAKKKEVSSDTPK